MDFGTALDVLKDGGKVGRRGWNGKGMSIELQRPGGSTKMTLPYIFLNTPNEPGAKLDRVPWLASQTDLLAEDWEMVD